MSRELYQDEVHRLAVDLYRRVRDMEPTWEQFLYLVETQSPWMADEGMHEAVLSYTGYHFGHDDHAEILKVMRPGDDWRMMRKLTAKLAMTTDVFEEWRAIAESMKEGTPKKRWLS